MIHLGSAKFQLANPRGYVFTIHLPRGGLLLSPPSSPPCAPLQTPSLGTPKPTYVSSAQLLAGT